jgi:hypothetical protein
MGGTKAIANSGRKKGLFCFQKSEARTLFAFGAISQGPRRCVRNARLVGVRRIAMGCCVVLTALTKVSDETKSRSYLELRV